MCNPDILPQVKIKEYREELLEEQEYLCDLCGLPILGETGSLDHLHIADNWDPATGAGQIRGVLHRRCNTILGYVENPRRAKKDHDNLEEWLLGAAAYVRKHREEPSGVYHNTERSKLNKLKGRKKKGSKKAGTIE